jgi:REP element-mobilizing transposase RayT
MPNHVHLIIIPQLYFNISRILKGIKGVTARKINLFTKTIGSIWQAESYDGIIRNENELKEKIIYIANNAVKWGLTDEPMKYIGFYLHSDCYLFLQ